MKTILIPLLSAFCLFFVSINLSVAQEENDQEESALFSGGEPSLPSHKFALIIFGEEPEDYEKRERTIQSLTTILKQNGFTENRIKILKNGGPGERPTATKENILAALKKYQPDNSQSQSGKGLELFVYASLKTVTHRGTQYLICPSNSRTLDEIDFSDVNQANLDSDMIRYKEDHLIDLQKQFVEPISKSPIERRVLILNTLSPKAATRGAMTVRERGVLSSQMTPATVSPQQAFGQIVISDSLRMGPETVNSFIDIYDKGGVLGYADRTGSGNFDGKVDMNELIDYLERFGNMASPGSVRTLFKGQDFNLKSYQPQKAVLDSQKQQRLQYMTRLKQQPLPQTATAQSNIPQGKWYCLLFSVNDVENTNVNDALGTLSGPANDMILLQEKWLLPMRQKMARSTKKKPEDVMEITFLTEKKEHGTASSTRDNFYNELKRITQKAGPNDFIVVAAACHGYSAHGLSFLCPHDLKQIPFHNAGDFTEGQNKTKVVSQTKIQKHVQDVKLIAIGDIIDSLTKAKAGKKLFLVDACRPETQKLPNSDFMTEFRTLMKRFYSDPDSRSNNLAVLTSCSYGQLAYDVQPGLGLDIKQAQGLFSYHLAEGLSEAKTGIPADIQGNLNGWVSLNEAYSYAFDKTHEYCVNRGYDIQTPELFRGSGWDTFSLMSASLEDRQLSHDLSNEDYLLQRALHHKRAKNYEKSREILTQLIDWEPNNSLAYEYRSGVHLASLDRVDRSSRFLTGRIYSQALADCEKIGKPLDLYVSLPNGSDRVAIYQGDPKKQLQQTKTTVYNNQKVSVSRIEPNGWLGHDWLYVVRSSDNASQEGLGWIASHRVTWSEKSVENYRPATKMVPQPRVQRPVNSSSLYHNPPMQRTHARQNSPVIPSGQSNPAIRAGGRRGR